MALGRRRRRDLTTASNAIGLVPAQEAQPGGLAGREGKSTSSDAPFPSARCERGGGDQRADVSTVVGRSQMVGVWGRRTGGGFLPRFLWLTAKKETQNKTKNKRPLCNYSSAKRSQRSLGRIPGHAPLPVSFYFHPPFIPLKPTPCLISRPLLSSLSPPPSGLLHKCTHTSTRKRHDFSLNPRRGRSRRRLSDLIPLRFGRDGIFFPPITKFGEYNVLPDWHKVTFAE